MSISTALQDLKQTIINKINSIDRYQIPLTHPPIGTLTDVLGTVEITDDGGGYIGTTCSQKDAYIANTNGMNYALLNKLPDGEYINLRNGNPQSVEVFRSTIFSRSGNDGTYFFGIIFAPCTLILPTQIIGLTLGVVVSDFSFCRGLYLNKYGSNVVGRSNWVENDYHISQANQTAKIYCDSGTNYAPMYFNKLYLDISTFDTFIDNLGTRTSTGKIYVGDANLSRMSTETIEKANAKGWVIS